MSIEHFELTNWGTKIGGSGPIFVSEYLETDKSSVP